MATEHKGSELVSRLLSVVTTTDPLGGKLQLFRDALARLELPSPWKVELLIADDLSYWPDQVSADLSAATQSGGVTTRILWYPGHRGQLAATVMAVSEARGDAVLTIDPDMHANLNEVPAMLAHLDEGKLLVHGPRRARPGLSFPRRAGSLIANSLVRLLTSIPVHDLGSPVTLIHRKALDTALPADSGNINPRLYLYLYHRRDLMEYQLQVPSPAFSRQSAYSLLALLRLFIQLIIQATHTRKAVTRRKAIDQKTP